MATARQLDSVISRREIFDFREGLSLGRRVGGVDFAVDVVGWVSLMLMLSAIVCIV